MVGGGDGAIVVDITGASETVGDAVGTGVLGTIDGRLVGCELAGGLVG